MVRRVVTGHDLDGRSVVVSDSQAVSIPFGAGGFFNLVWARDDGWGNEHFASGCQFTVYELPVGDSSDLDRFVVESMSEFADATRPGMHATPTVDLDIVLAGVVGLELDDEEVRLEVGDVVVLNGNLHRWHNRGDTTAVVAAVCLGTAHSE